jgi:hypothetical protein
MQILMLTDIAMGWTECGPLLVRDQKLFAEALSEMRQRMPAPLPVSSQKHSHHT